MKFKLSILLFLCFVILLSSNNGMGQEVKKDNRVSTIIEDPYNFYEEGAISKTDILKALEVLGARIYKFELPGDSEKGMITVLARAFKEGKEFSIDTIAYFSNEYRYWETGTPDHYVDFIDKMTVFTSTDGNSSKLQFDLTASVRRHEMALDKSDEDQFYVWRKYQKVHIEKGKEIPVLMFASSWVFPDEDFHRFCGAAELSENDPMTQELLDYSPHYIRISFRVD